MRRHIHSAILSSLSTSSIRHLKAGWISDISLCGASGRQYTVRPNVYFIAFKFGSRENISLFSGPCFQRAYSCTDRFLYVTFPVGFFMSKYVVFSDSNMKGRIQIVPLSADLFCLTLDSIICCWRYWWKISCIYPVAKRRWSPFSLVVIFGLYRTTEFSFKATQKKKLQTRESMDSTFSEVPSQLLRIIDLLHGVNAGKCNLF